MHLVRITLKMIINKEEEGFNAGSARDVEYKFGWVNIIVRGSWLALWNQTANESTKGMGSNIRLKMHDMRGILLLHT